MRKDDKGKAFKKTAKEPAEMKEKERREQARLAARWTVNRLIEEKIARLNHWQEKTIYGFPGPKAFRT